VAGPLNVSVLGFFLRAAFCSILGAIIWASAAARSIDCLTHEEPTARKFYPCLRPLLPPFLLWHRRADLSLSRYRSSAPAPPHGCLEGAAAINQAASDAADATASSVPRLG
jgi:hypothetical protein